MTKEEVLMMVKKLNSMEVNSMATSMLKKDLENKINKYGKEYGISI